MAKSKKAKEDNVEMEIASVIPDVEWKTEKRFIKDLIPHPRNPRSLSKRSHKDLINSLQKYNYVELAAINLDNMILAGHQRIHVMQDIGWGEKEIEVRVPSRLLTQKECDNYLLISNKVTGDWDYDIMSNQWEEQELFEGGFNEEDLVGKYEVDIEQIESDLEEGEEMLTPGSDEEAYTKFGDVYELNGHRLICGDSTLPDIVFKLLNGEEPILMVTDPPYGVNYDPNWRNEAGKGQRAGGKVQNDDIVDWRVTYSLFPGSVAYVWRAGKYSPEVAKNLQDCEFEIISQIIWAKQHFALSRGDYHWKHEPCWYAVRKGHSHNWQGSRKESTVWDIANHNAFGGGKEDKDDERTSHGTQKPIECMAIPIRNNSAKGEIVYDPFLGSGTTLIASELLDRKCYGVELSPAYCDIIVNRYKNYMNKKNKKFKIYKNGELHSQS